MSTHNSHVIITGGGQGMGRSHCLELLDRGARVTILDRDEVALEETVSLADEAAQLLALPCDVADRSSVESAVAQSAKHFGGVDAIVSNAGTIHTTQGILDTDDNDWDRTMSVHVGGARNLCRAAVPHLRKSEAPRIVIVSSMWAQCGPGFGYAYCSAKGALLAFAKNLAVELGPDQILVNAIAPGSVPTRMTAEYTDADIRHDCLEIPLGRWAEFGEISRLVAFLVSPELGYVTGQTIPINGGQIIAGI